MPPIIIVVVVVGVVVAADVPVLDRIAVQLQANTYPTDSFNTWGCSSSDDLQLALFLHSPLDSLTSALSGAPHRCG